MPNVKFQSRLNVGIPISTLDQWTWFRTDSYVDDGNLFLLTGGKTVVCGYCEAYRMNDHLNLGPIGTFEPEFLVFPVSDDKINIEVLD
jgi:hypothetical protein